MTDLGIRFHANSKILPGEKHMRCARVLVSLVLVGSVMASLSAASIAAPPGGLIEKETPSGTIVGYRDTPMLPSAGGKYHVHDPDRPIPKFVKTVPCPADSLPCPPPSDALVLFSGDGLDAWEETDWKVESGAVIAGEHSNLTTKAAFGDIQLHLEWMAPVEPSGNMMNRGNSGVLLMGTYELQIFDSHPSHKVQIYPDGQAAAIYGQTPPLVNACRPPGEWQQFDIIFIAPRFKDGKLTQPGRITVFHNGVLVQLNEAIQGPMAHRVIVPYSPHAAKLPLSLQGHGSPVRFRNIWVRPVGESS
jgi:hypothetical protein